MCCGDILFMLAVVLTWYLVGINSRGALWENIDQSSAHCWSLLPSCTIWTGLKGKDHDSSLNWVLNWLSLSFSYICHCVIHSNFPQINSMNTFHVIPSHPFIVHLKSSLCYTSSQGCWGHTLYSNFQSG